MFKDEDESIEKQFHMLPKKMLEEDRDQGMDTLIEGDKAL